MNGNSRRKSETESSSSLESRDPLRISSSSDSLRSQVPHPKDRVTHHHRSLTFFN
ncbi:hypothetical protein YC2023_084084 [Brassica napus]